jgi:polysaccharide export outer membrane protein
VGSEKLYFRSNYLYLLGRLSGCRAADKSYFESKQREDFVLVEVNRQIAETVSNASLTKTTASFISDTRAAPVTIGSGDILDIAIISTSENGFIDFSQSSVSPVSATPLPPQQVGSDGNVNVPPVGRVRASGQTIQQFETFLARKLGEVLVNPSVIVNLTDRRSARVSVLGAVNAPGAFSINQESTHLIDALTLAGGQSALQRPSTTQRCDQCRAVAQTLHSHGCQQ